MELRYLNSESVGVNLEFELKTNGFEKKICFLFVKSGLAPTDLEFRDPSSKSVGVDLD